MIERSDGRFQLMSGGSIAPFMSGYAYVLVERPLSEFLVNLAVDGVQARSAIIFRLPDDVEFGSHDSLWLYNRFDAEDIAQLDVSGDRMFLMDRSYVFVTPSLKDTLEQAGFDYLEFREGLNGFAGESDPKLDSW